MSRLRLDMSFNDALFAMSEGNPGAIRVMMDALQVAEQADPEGMGAWGFLLNLDTFEIYSNRIWRLYKNLCGESVLHSVALVRCVQMGVLDRKTLDEAIDGTGTLDIPATVAALKERLPSFQI